MDDRGVYKKAEPATFCEFSEPAPDQPSATCSLGTIGPGSSQTFDIWAAFGRYSSLGASSRSAVSCSCSETATANNKANLSVEIDPVADIKVTVSAPESSSGDPIQSVFRIKNQGPGPTSVWVNVGIQGAVIRTIFEGDAECESIDSFGRPGQWDYACRTITLQPGDRVTIAVKSQPLRSRTISVIEVDPNKKRSIDRNPDNDKSSATTR
jgi:hypothetical protein